MASGEASSSTWGWGEGRKRERERGTRCKQGLVEREKRGVEGWGAKKEEKGFFSQRRKEKMTPYPEELVKVDDVAAHGRGALEGGGRGRRRACFSCCWFLSFFFSR